MVAKYTRQGADQARKYGARLTFAFGKKNSALKISNISAFHHTARIN